jgi:hypothetical protein
MKIRIFTTEEEFFDPIVYTKLLEYNKTHLIEIFKTKVKELFSFIQS